jgi:hypothetical protein
MIMLVPHIAKKELASRNQNPRIEWWQEVPPLDSWILCPKQNLLCYILNFVPWYVWDCHENILEP